MLTPDLLNFSLAQFSPYIGKPLQNRLLLVPPPGDSKIIPAKTYFDSNYLCSSLEAFAESHNIADLAIAASLWNKLYNNALIPAVLIVMTLLGIGLDTSLDNVSVVIENEAPQAIILHRLDRGTFYPPRYGQKEGSNIITITALSEFHAYIFRPLFEHLHYLINQIHALTSLSRSVMWGNTGNVCDYLYTELSNCPGKITATQEDRAMIFEQPRSPTGIGHNPLYRTVIDVSIDDSEFAKPTMVRQTCCLLFKVPLLHCCGNCPVISRDERLARAKH